MSRYSRMVTYWESSNRNCAFNQADWLKKSEISTTERSESFEPEKVDGVDGRDLDGIGVRLRRHDGGLNENRVSGV